jgi:myosin heavy subunit
VTGFANACSVSVSVFFSGTTQVEKEITLRKRAEANDASLRKELMQAQDRIAALEIDLQRTQVTTESAQSSWSREKSRLVAEYTHQIQQLTAEKEAIELDAQRQVQAKVQEMNKKWETSIQTLKGHEMELTRQQWESEHARSLIELQKKCQRDIESVRSEERTLAAQEIESLRGAFLQRERQTTQDLIELEKLHAKRVQQLEFQYQQEKTANEQLKQRLNDLLLDQDRRHHDTLYQSDAWQRKNHEMTLQCDQLKRDLKSMQEDVANSKAGENNAREQLRQLSMEMKLLQAERAELQRQATGHGVEVSQWKQVVQEQEKNYHAIETTARVAKEEIAFLEHENHRLKTENAKLRFDVEKADRLIYGVSQHQADPKRSYPMKLDAKFHEAAGTAASAGAPSSGNGMNTSAISNAGTTVFGTATQATPSRQATPSQRPPTVPGSATSATGTSKLGLDTTVLPHSRHSFHRHTLHSPTESNRSRSPRRLSPTHASATFSSASRSASAKRR